MGNIQIQEHITNATGKEIHLKFTHDNSNVAMNHYNCILLLEEPIPCHTDEQVTIESLPLANTGRATCVDDADVIDLLEDCDSTASEHPEMPHNNSGDNLQFPMHLFHKTEGECVDELPHDIDGFKLYKIKCSQQEWVEKSKDLWHFKMNTSRRKDLIGTRKVGRCQGSLYCMSAQCPFKCSAEGTPNTMNFENVRGHKVCFSCRSISTRKWCGPRKLTEYCRASCTLTVYHVGVHKCHLKKDTQIYKKQVREAMLWNRGLGACGIQQAEVGQAVTDDNIKEAQRRAMRLSYANVRLEKAKIA